MSKQPAQHDTQHLVLRISPNGKEVIFVPRRTQKPTIPSCGYQAPKPKLSPTGKEVIFIPRRQPKEVIKQPIMYIPRRKPKEVMIIPRRGEHKKTFVNECGPSYEDVHKVPSNDTYIPELSQLYSNREFEAPIDVFTPQDDLEVGSSHEYEASDDQESSMPYVDMLATPDDFQLNENSESDDEDGFPSQSIPKDHAWPEELRPNCSAYAVSQLHKSQPSSSVSSDKCSLGNPAALMQEIRDIQSRLQADNARMRQELADMMKEYSESLAFEQQWQNERQQEQNEIKQLQNDLNLLWQRSLQQPMPGLTLQYPSLQQPMHLPSWVNSSHPAGGYPVGVNTYTGPAGGYPVGVNVINTLAGGYPASSVQAHQQEGLDAQQVVNKPDSTASNQDVLSMDIQQQQQSILSMDAQHRQHEVPRTDAHHQQHEVPRTDAQQHQQQSVGQPYQQISANLGDGTTQLPCSAAEQAAETGMTSTLHTSQLKNVQVIEEALGLQPKLSEKVMEDLTDIRQSPLAAHQAEWPRHETSIAELSRNSSSSLTKLNESAISRSKLQCEEAHLELEVCPVHSKPKAESLVFLAQDRLDALLEVLLDDYQFLACPTEPPNVDTLHAPTSISSETSLDDMTIPASPRSILDANIMPMLALTSPAELMKTIPGAIFPELEDGPAQANSISLLDPAKYQPTSKGIMQLSNKLIRYFGSLNLQISSLR